MAAVKSGYIIILTHYDVNENALYWAQNFASVF